ncbi:MAG: AbrB/MazE/SpoVT family DNA-binding domain-containing protein [Dehalococcoidia bacterium]
MKTIVMNQDGRLTLPAEVRRILHLRGETEFEVEVDESADAIVLRPALVLRREDAWAYTPEHRELLARAHRDSREGRVRHLTEEELARLGEHD